MSEETENATASLITNKILNNPGCKMYNSSIFFSITESEKGNVVLKKLHVITRLNVRARIHTVVQLYALGHGRQLH